MAIKVSGTTVIDDSRALTNIASVDATTVASLGAAGVGGVGDVNPAGELPDQPRVDGAERQVFVVVDTSLRQ